MFPAVIDARVKTAFKLKSKMFLHGFKALQEDYCLNQTNQSVTEASRPHRKCNTTTTKQI